MISFHSVFEEMIDDMNYNIINKRRKEQSTNGSDIEELNESISKLRRLITSANEEREFSERLLYVFQQENNALNIEYERVKTVNFHNNIEIAFLQKRNRNTQEEIDKLNREIRQMDYGRFSIIKKNGNNSEMKKKSIEIETLISQKKILATSIVLMNKKIIEITAKIGFHMKKSEMIFENFNNAIQQGK